MKVTSTDLKEVLLIEPRVFADNRGYFYEAYHRERYFENGIRSTFIQDNFSYSVQGTLRGLHYQSPKPQAKLVQILQGEIYDIAVDIRKGSPTFGNWVGVYLSDRNKRQLFIPEGFAHGFAVLSPVALFAYKCSDLFSPECEGGIKWNDPDLGIRWPLDKPILSEKDSGYPCLKDIESGRLPVYGGDR
ncbi:MAG: dTDP-4-dehydrorhamnose 3,5-epimerase [Desulfobacteraceae bacterium]|nr:MAG: dTDP-4-dehydrorhamnose 3,5-epimerase [Desulfobacteraceae bacterium]